MKDFEKQQSLLPEIWEVYFLQLTDYLAENNNKYPSKEQNESLYQWLSFQKKYKDNGSLSLEQLKKLNSIGFLGYINERNWNAKFELLQKYAEKNEYEPNHKNELYYWYKDQKRAIKKGTLKQERKEKFQSISFKTKSVEDNWLIRFDELVKYAAENDSEPTIKEELYTWYQAQKHALKKGTLIPARKEKFQSISFNPNGTEDNWLIRFNELVKYAAENDSEPSKKEELYTWYQGQKHALKKGTLNPERKEKFQSISFNPNWNVKFELLKKYAAENDSEPHHKDALYSWYQTQKRAIKKGTLNHEKKGKIESLSFNSNWHIYFALLKKYAEENNGQPKTKTKLYDWYRRQKQAIIKGTLSKERKEKIESISFKPVSLADKWLTYFNRLVKFREANPESWALFRIKGKLKNKPMTVLARFCKRMRDAFHEHSLSDFQLEKLSSINFNFEGKSDVWQEKYDILKNYIDKYQAFPHSKDEIFAWAKYQLTEARSLTSEQIQLLDNIHLRELYHKPKVNWEDKYNEVKVFYTLKGKLPSERSHKQLGTWIGNQRDLYKKGRLDAEKTKKLERLGIVWDGKKAIIDRWNEMFEAVTFFYVQNNRFPKPNSRGKEKQLFCWINFQQQKYASIDNRNRATPLLDWQLKKLESIGFGRNPKVDLEGIWDKNYEKLCDFCKEKPLSELPSKINGKSNPVYYWLAIQKNRYKNGLLAMNRIEKLKRLGVSFEG